MQPSRRAIRRPPVGSIPRTTSPLPGSPVDVLILGASARAAAYSARRADLQPACIDLFADRDLAAVCPSRRIAPEH
jgi:hypothetical protein